MNETSKSEICSLHALIRAVYMSTPSLSHTKNKWTHVNLPPKLEENIRKSNRFLKIHCLANNLRHFSVSNGQTVFVSVFVNFFKNKNCAREIINLKDCCKIRVTRFNFKKKHYPKINVDKNIGILRKKRNTNFKSVDDKDRTDLTKEKHHTHSIPVQTSPFYSFILPETSINKSNTKIQNRNNNKLQNSNNKNNNSLIYIAQTSRKVNERNFTYRGAGAVLWFSKRYMKIHGYLCCVVCSFGVVTNIANVVVLTRPSMLSSVNLLLTALAVSDGLTMLFYLGFVLRFYIIFGTEENPTRNSIYTAHFIRLFSVIFVLTHTVAIWITVTLAIFRLFDFKFKN